MAQESWKKSSRSGPNVDCVLLRGDLKAVRDSKLGPEGPVLRFPRPILAAFLEAVKDGRLDG